MKRQANLRSTNARSHGDWIPESSSIDLEDDDHPDHDSIDWQNDPNMHSVADGTDAHGVTPFYGDTNPFDDEMQPNILHDASIPCHDEHSSSNNPLLHSAMINNDHCPTIWNDNFNHMHSHSHRPMYQTHQALHGLFHTHGQEQVYHPHPTNAMIMTSDAPPGLPSSYLPNQNFAIQDGSSQQQLSPFLPYTRNLDGHSCTASFPAQNPPDCFGPTWFDSNYVNAPAAYSLSHTTSTNVDSPMENGVMVPNGMEYAHSISPSLDPNYILIPFASNSWPVTTQHGITPSNNLTQIPSGMEYNPPIPPSMVMGNDDHEKFRLFDVRNNIVTAHDALFLNDNQWRPGIDIGERNQPLNNSSSIRAFMEEKQGPHKNAQLQNHDHEMKQQLPPRNDNRPVSQQDPVSKQQEPQPTTTKKKRNRKQTSYGNTIRRLIHANGSMNIYLGRGAPIRDTSGNKLLSRLVDEQLKDYIVADNAGKTAIRANIRQTLINQGLKFFIITESGAFQGECSDSKIDDKIGHALRDAPKKYSSRWFWKHKDDDKNKMWKSFGKEGAKLEKGQIIYSNKRMVQYEIVDVTINHGEGNENHKVNLRTMEMAKVSDGSWNFVVDRASDKETMKERRKEMLVTDSDGANDNSDSGDATCNDSSTNESTTRSTSQSNNTSTTPPSSSFSNNQFATMPSIGNADSCLRCATTREVENAIMYGFMVAYTRYMMQTPISQQSRHRSTNVLEEDIHQLPSPIHEGLSDDSIACIPSEPTVVDSTKPTTNDNRDAQRETVTSTQDKGVIWLWRENRTRMEKHRPESVFGNPNECWIRYEKEMSFAIERAYQAQGGKGQFGIPKYKVDFGSMRQTSLRSGYQRQLKRVTLDFARKDTDGRLQRSRAGNDASRTLDSDDLKGKVSTDLNLGQRVSSRAQPDCGKELHSNANDDQPPNVVWIWRETRTRMEMHKSEHVFGDPKECWIRYEKDISRSIERSFQAQRGSGQFRMSKYEIDFGLMRQTNIATGYQRQVKRIVETTAGPRKMADSRPISMNQGALLVLGVAEKLDRATLHHENIGTTLDTGFSATDSLSPNRDESPN